MSDNRDRRTESPKFKMIILLFVVGLIVGILFAIQINTPQPRSTNPVMPFAALQDTKKTLEQDQNDLKEKVAKLRADNVQRQNLIKRRKRGSKKLVEELEGLKDEAGLTAKKGEGVIITIADSQDGELSIDSIVHAADLRDIVDLLWRNGAEAISINDQRIVSVSSIDSIVNTILVNNTKIANPFEVKVIGSASKIREALLSGKYLKDIYHRKKINGLIFNVGELTEVSISGYDGGFIVKYASIKK